MRIGIIVDSGSNFSEKEVDMYDLGWIPLHIVYPDGDIIEDLPLLGEDLYDDIATGSLSTSQPTPATIANVFENMLKRYDYAVYIAMSSALSGTYDAANMVLSQMNTTRIKIIDSKQITIGIDVLVMRLLEAIKEGLTFDKIDDFMENIRNRQKFYFLLETLEHLKRGGRIGRARYVVSSVLKVVPLLVIDKDGYINAYRKARGVVKVINMIREYVKSDNITERSYMHVVMGRPKHKAIIPFAQELENTYGAKIKPVRPLTAVHVGIWGIGVSYIEEG